MITDEEKKQLKAMISLMDEPDEETYLKIRHQVYAYGKEALPLLEKAMEETFSELMHQRINGIMQSIRQESLYSDLREWVRLGSSDLMNGHLLVTRNQYPDLDETSIINRIEQMRMSMWLELNDNLTPMDNVRVINHILYDVNLFEGNKIHLNAPQNQYLNTLLETRRGSPLSLGMLYLALTSRLNLPIYGVNLPQHFILTYLNGPATEKTTEDDVLFYINPFNKGAVFTRREIDLFLRQVNIQPEKSFFLPCSNIDIIERLLNVLIYTYNQLGYPEKIMDLQLLLRALQEKI